MGSSTFSSAISCTKVIKYYDEESRVIAWADQFIGAVNYHYTLAASAQETANEIIPAKPFTLKLTNNFVGHTILPGSVNFTWNGHRYIDRLGKLYRDPDHTSGLGVEVGTIDYSTGIATLTVYDGGSNTIAVNSLSARFGKQLLSAATFRTPGAPLRPGSISISGVCDDGRTISGAANFDGTISGTLVRGQVDYGNPLTAGLEITLNRANIANVELYDSSPLPLRVPSTKYAFDKDTQKLTMANPLDLAGFIQPIIANHRIEDMALVSSVQINGQVIVASGLQNAYPVEKTYVSTAMLFGDLQARAYNLFDQKTWASEWSDDLVGDATGSNYNEIDYPAVVTNAGAVRERWALVFTDPTHFNIVGEVYGVVGSGYTTQDCSPINPSTGQPFFFLDYRGWGVGWAAGNVLRLNTEGANHDLWIARTTLQGPATEPNDQFTLQIRGDAE